MVAGRSECGNHPGPKTYEVSKCLTPTPQELNSVALNARLDQAARAVLIVSRLHRHVRSSRANRVSGFSVRSCRQN